MKQNRRRFLSVVAAAALTGSARPAPITRERFRALGTEAQITLAGHPHKAVAALQACRTEIAAIESAFSLYDSTSLLSRLNRDGKVTTNHRFSTLVRHALAMAEATNGAFDPTMQPLWRALAESGDYKNAQRLIGWRDLRLTADAARFNRPHMAASFNGIAQGFAADQVTAVLAQHGFRDTLVDLGEFSLQGTRHGKRWLLGIRDPLSQHIIAQIEPAAGAIATSEPHGTIVAGHPHIIDPLNRPGKRWSSVTVEAREAWRADALSTAIAASPVQEADRLLATGGATRGWLITTAGTLEEWHANKDPQQAV